MFEDEDEQLSQISLMGVDTFLTGYKLFSDIMLVVFFNTKGKQFTNIAPVQLDMAVQVRCCYMHGL